MAQPSADSGPSPSWEGPFPWKIVSWVCPEMKGLIIREPWISLILSRKKTWELRSRDTRVRGRIALIRKGSGTVVGVAELVGTLPKLSRSSLISNVKKHRTSRREFHGDLKY